MSNVLNEQFEGVGLPSGWTVATGVAGAITDPSNTENILSGLKSLKIFSPSVAINYAQSPLLALAPVDFFFLVNIPIYPMSSNMDLVLFLDSELNMVLRIQVSNAVARFRFNHGDTSVNTAADLVGGTTYAIWVDYTKATSDIAADGIANLYYSADPLTKGTAKATITTGTSTADISYMRFNTQNRPLNPEIPQGTVWFDNIQAETVIGDAGMPEPVVVDIAIPGLIASPLGSVLTNEIYSVDVVAIEDIEAPTVTVENLEAFPVLTRVSLGGQAYIEQSIAANSISPFGSFLDVPAGDTYVTITNRDPGTVIYGEVRVLAFTPPPENTLLLYTAFGEQPPFVEVDYGSAEESIIDFDDTSMPAAGKGASMLLAPYSNDRVGITVTPRDEDGEYLPFNQCELYVSLRCTTVPPSTLQVLFSLVDADGIEQVRVNLRNSGYVQIYHGTVLTSNALLPQTSGQFYDFYLQYSGESVEGANDGSLKLFISTDQIRPITPTITAENCNGRVAHTLSIGANGKGHVPVNVGGYILRRGDYTQGDLITNSEVADLWAIATPPKILSIGEAIIGETFTVEINEEEPAHTFTLNLFEGSSDEVQTVSVSGSVYTLELSRRLPIGTSAILTYTTAIGTASIVFTIKPPANTIYTILTSGYAAIPEFSILNRRAEFYDLIPGDVVTITADWGAHAENYDALENYAVGLSSDGVVQFLPTLPPDIYTGIELSVFKSTDNWNKVTYPYNITVEKENALGVITIAGLTQVAYRQKATIIDDAGYTETIKYDWYIDDVLSLVDSDSIRYSISSDTGKMIYVQVTYTDVEGTTKTLKSNVVGPITNPTNIP